LLSFSSAKDRADIPDRITSSRPTNPQNPFNSFILNLFLTLDIRPKALGVDHVEDHVRPLLQKDVDLPSDFMRFLIGFSSISSVIICKHKTRTEPKGYEEQ
jgi:hypothetical protein